MLSRTNIALAPIYNLTSTLKFPSYFSFEVFVAPVSFLQSTTSTARLQIRGIEELAIGLVSVFLILRYGYVYLRFRRAQRFPGVGLEAPTFPSFLTRLETNLLLLFWEKRLVYFATACGDTQTPVRLNIFPEPIYLVQGKHAITSLWRQSAKSQALGLLNFPFRVWFQMPQKLVDKFVWDTSGCAKKPLPKSNVKPQNRTERISQNVFKEVLNGSTFPSTCTLFVERLSGRLVKMELGCDWAARPDLLTFFHDHVTPPNIESLWGTQLTVHSSFAQDFWPFDLNLHHFSRQFPRRLTPKTWSRRDRMLDVLRQWQKFEVNDNLENTTLRWGSNVLRERMLDFLQVDGTNMEDLAPLHLTFLWAANANIVPLCFWAVLNIFQDPELLRQLRNRLPKIRSLTEFCERILKKEIRDQICADDLLLSIYAETLRLRVNTCILRRFPHEEVDLAGMKIAKDRLCIVSTYPAHMRGREWNTGGGVHPLENFWAYRFLENCYSEAYQGNEPPKVGTKTKYREKDPRSSISLYSDSSRKFSMKGLEGSWIPYGGGASICPGRHLAKHHFLVTVAAMILLFDLEVIASEKMMQMSNFYYGVGVQHPKGQIPFRIRRRV